MGVVEKLRLKILSKNDLREVERDVTKEEKLARRHDIASKKINGRTGPVLPSSLTRKEARLEKLGLGGGRLEQSASLAKQKVDAFAAGGVGAPIQKTNRFLALEKTVAKQQIITKNLSSALGKVGFLGAAAANPGQAFASQGIAAATKFFLPAAVVVSIAQLVIDYWIKSYGKGGVNDPRKKILNDVKSLIGIDREQEILEGKLYFANSRTLKPGQEVRSNTMNLNEGYDRARIHRAPYGRGGFTG
jgi:hypothetical protein